MGKIAIKLATQSAEFKDLFLGKFPEQQLKAGHSEKYYEILTDFDFISLKIQYPKFGVEALVRDYALIDDPEIWEKSAAEKLESEQIKILRLIQRTLDLSAHVLNQNPNQLIGQLWGRLQNRPESEIQKILDEAAQSKYEAPQFIPITASLTTPDGNLLRTLTGHDDPVNAVAITPDGQKAVSGSGDKTLKVWELNTGKQLFTLTGHDDWVNAVAITPDGQKAVSGSWDKTLKVWELNTGKQLFTLTGHDDWVNAVAITPDGQKAVSGSGDNTLKVWELNTGKQLFTLTGHDNIVQAVAITPDGQKAVSGSGDKTLKVWDLKTGQEISTFIGDSSINCCAISPDGLIIVAGEGSGRIHFLRLECGSENE
jgi:WD40 repeat protein